MTLDLGSDDVARIAELLERIEDPAALSGERSADSAWERRELAIAELAALLRATIMQR